MHFASNRRENMHLMGFVVVTEPTNEAVDKAMSRFEGEHWDWYRPGGRWDGYFQSFEERARRQTHNGFNFDPINEQIDNNTVKVRDLPQDKKPYFLVVDGEWHEKESYQPNVPNPK